MSKQRKPTAKDCDHRSVCLAPAKWFLVNDSHGVQHKVFADTPIRGKDGCLTLLRNCNLVAAFPGFVAYKVVE